MADELSSRRPTGLPASPGSTVRAPRAIPIFVVIRRDDGRVDQCEAWAIGWSGQIVDVIWLDTDDGLTKNSLFWASEIHREIDMPTTTTSPTSGPSFRRVRKGFGEAAIISE